MLSQSASQPNLNQQPAELVNNQQTKKESEPREENKSDISFSELEVDYNNIDIVQGVNVKISTENINLNQALNHPNLRQIGYDLHNNNQTHFFSNYSPSVTAPSSYKLTSNDLVTLFIYGKKEQVMELKIDNSGEVFIPGSGPILVLGLTISETLKVEKIKKRYTNFKCKLKLTSLKPVSVIISGDVLNPGVYTQTK